MNIGTAREMGKSKFCSNPLRLPKHKKLKALNKVPEDIALDFTSEFTGYDRTPGLKLCMNCLRAVIEKLEFESTPNEDPPQVEVEPAEDIGRAPEAPKHILQVIAPSMRRRSTSIVTMSCSFDLSLTLHNFRITRRSDVNRSPMERA